MWKGEEEREWAWTMQFASAKEQTDPLTPPSHTHYSTPLHAASVCQRVRHLPIENAIEVSLKPLNCWQICANLDVKGKLPLSYCSPASSPTPSGGCHAWELAHCALCGKVWPSEALISSLSSAWREVLGQNKREAQREGVRGRRRKRKGERERGRAGIATSLGYFATLFTGKFCCSILYCKLFWRSWKMLLAGQATLVHIRDGSSCST